MSNDSACTDSCVITDLNSADDRSICADHYMISYFRRTCFRLSNCDTLINRHIFSYFG